MRKIILAIGLLGIFILGTQEALCQCECAFVPGSIKLSAHEAFKTAEVVFTGEIIDVDKVDSSNDYDVKFKVKSVWKKDVGESVVLRTDRESCGFFGEKGDEYLVYAYVLNGMLTTNGCTRTRLLAKAAGDLKAFEDKGEKPIKIYETSSNP